MPSRLRPRLILPILLALSLVAVGLYALSTRLGDNSRLTASGTVEAEEIRIAPEIPGRVLAVLAEEGQTVVEGDRLILLDDTMIQAQRQRVVASVAAAEQGLLAADLNAQAAAFQQEMVLAGARAQDSTRQRQSWQREAEAGVDLPTWYLTQEEMLAAAQAEVESAQAAVAAAQRHLQALLADPAHAEFQRAEARLRQAQAAFLAADAAYQRALAARDTQDLYSRAEDERRRADDELEAAQTALDDLLDDKGFDEVRQARADLAVAEARLSGAEAHRDSLRTGTRSLEVELGRVRLAQAQTAVEQARAALQQAQAELHSVDVQLERLVLRAPADGTVLTRSTDPGEILATGAPAMTLGLLDNLTITVYLPEDRYGEVRLGDPVRIAVDSFPGQVFEGNVLRIAERAEFTPRNVQTEEGRRTTVFAVDIAIANPGGLLKPGMPADVEFVSTP